MKPHRNPAVALQINTLEKRIDELLALWSVENDPSLIDQIAIRADSRVVKLLKLQGFKELST